MLRVAAARSNSTASARSSGAVAMVERLDRVALFDGP
jgi:hypothetical protein